MDGDLWGPGRDQDFWTALRAGHVPDTERRAVALLARVCDPHRFGLYCMTGQLPAVGNVTRLLYRIRRHHRVVEYDRDGHACGQWCISIGPHAAVPPTDNVVALKNLIEGEEPSFRATGNRGSYFDPFPPAPDGVVDPFAEPMFSLYDVEPQHEWAVRGAIDAIERLGSKDLLDFNWAMDEGRHVFDEFRANEAMEQEGALRPGVGYIEQARALMDRGFVQLVGPRIDMNPAEMRDAIARRVEREIGGQIPPLQQYGDNGTGMNPIYNNNVGCFGGAANVGGFNSAGVAAGVQYVVGGPPVGGVIEQQAWTPRIGETVMLRGCPTHGSQPGGDVIGRWPEVLHIVSGTLNPSLDEVREWARCRCLRPAEERDAALDDRRYEEAMQVGLDTLEVLHHAQSAENAIRLLEHRREMRARDRVEATAPAGGNGGIGAPYIRRNPRRIGVPVGDVQWGEPDMEPMLPPPQYEGPGIPVVRPIGGGNPRGPWNRVEDVGLVGRPLFRNPEGRFALAL